MRDLTVEEERRPSDVSRCRAVEDENGGHQRPRHGGDGDAGEKQRCANERQCYGGHADGVEASQERRGEIIGDELGHAAEKKERAQRSRRDSENLSRVGSKVHEPASVETKVESQHHQQAASAAVPKDCPECR
jgi:ribosome assembly protein YihI (activator of Der GTPase)